jgi:uncharacterized protein YecE (DUF72 family)
MPNAKTLQGWNNSTGPEFRFALKASRRITHWERLRIPSEALNYLLGVVTGLERRLGLMLYQLPPDFQCDLQALRTFLSALPQGIRSAFEFRHDSWHRGDTYEILREHGAALCLQDRDGYTTPLEVTAPFTYVRLRRSNYDAPLRDEWLRRIRAWAASGLDVYAYLKHEDNPDAPLMAREFAEGLGLGAAAA